MEETNEVLQLEAWIRNCHKQSRRGRARQSRTGRLSFHHEYNIAGKRLGRSLDTALDGLSGTSVRIGGALEGDQG